MIKAVSVRNKQHSPSLGFRKEKRYVKTRNDNLGRGKEEDERKSSASHRQERREAEEKWTNTEARQGEGCIYNVKSVRDKGKRDGGSNE
ncbi:hypothetical protein K435DRAFT_779777 [Dendrothele bispora CBS 962.96]|uniref:Uncharacterized protein n=1 Tax=Dendrothele bispora (strain CBS 962.96) TaxID=1314807 RepID=A0A4S8LVM6_DENBC|nr:hypothetical protein K435DRAFT_779777 [Dendrothele bispora CBS 962.96]